LGITAGGGGWNFELFLDCTSYWGLQNLGTESRHQTLIQAFQTLLIGA
jgi:hypothetical protein